MKVENNCKVLTEGGPRKSCDILGVRGPLRSGTTRGHARVRAEKGPTKHVAQHATESMTQQEGHIKRATRQGGSGKHIKRVNRTMTQQGVTYNM